MSDFEMGMIKRPKPSGWECELFGLGRQIVVQPYEGHVPNWFWRITQYLIFGNRWIWVGTDTEDRT